ncbi:integrase catalytic domain-containing protein [Nephila pilipes]|uniref:Integrase catalytic domain-containing protein n=1 Tax=Nephila pilipes TaxID=299642 RepID=A0A8X6MQP0_NEPPI|nr:integrase catalytic domain-containing protein [Nephila pilipes]
MVNDPVLYKECREVVDDYLEEGIVEFCMTEADESSFYLPHHAVVREDKVSSRLSVYSDLFPETCETLLKSFWVDDLVEGTEQVETALKITTEIMEILKNVGMDDEQQRLSIIDLEEISDEAKNRYITARRSELRAAAAALDDTAQAWGKKFIDDDFTIVKSKKKSQKTISDNSAKKQKREEITPCLNKFGHLTIEDAPEPSTHEMDTSPPSPISTAQRTSTPPQSPSHPPKPKQAPPKQENSWRKRLQLNSAPPQPAPRQTIQLTEEEFPQLPSPPKKTRRTPPTNYQAIQNPLEMLNDPDVQELYNILEKFVNIAKNVPTPAERLQALFKLLN